MRTLFDHRTTLILLTACVLALALDLGFGSAPSRATAQLTAGLAALVPSELQREFWTPAGTIGLRPTYSHTPANRCTMPPDD